MLQYAIILCYALLHQLMGLRKGLIVILLMVSVLPLINSVIASSNTDIGIKQERINPGSFYYSLKRAWEKVRWYFTFSDQNKVNYHQDLLNKRLSELKYVVDNKLLSEVETSSQRFAYQAGVLADVLKKMNDKEGNALLLEDFEKYKLVLNKLRDNYPANSSFWMLIQHDINTLKILSEQIK